MSRRQRRKARTSFAPGSSEHDGNDSRNPWSMRDTFSREDSRRAKGEEEGVLYTVKVATRPPTPRKTKSEQLRDFVRAKRGEAKEYTTSLIQSVSETSQGLYERIKPSTVAKYQSESDFSEKSNTSSLASHSSSSSSSDSLDPFESDEDDDAFRALPQSLPDKQKNALKSKTLLARSLVGNLVVTPSMKNLLLQSENDDDVSEKDDEKDDEWKGDESKKSIKDLQMQFTITKKDKRPYGMFTYPIGRVCSLLGLPLSKELRASVDKYRYQPSRLLYRYVSWTFYNSFVEVFFSFLIIFMLLCLIFAVFLYATGKRKPECIVVSGEPFGTNPDTMFNDAFALSWMTFTTVGYGNVYTATGTDFDTSHHRTCSMVVFICTLEAFVGLLFAGMCAAILFGKVNRVQCHANVVFCNAACLVYETEAESFIRSFRDDSDEDSEEDKPTAGVFKPTRGLQRQNTQRGGTLNCPVIKFQVVNEFSNKEGGDIVDATMKLIGVKMKTDEIGKITHSQIVRLNLVDTDHPFFSRVWHGVHILDESSQLLTYNARKQIRNNEGNWPRSWFHNPDKIRKKLDFHSMVLTISGTSNLSANSVHAYKRYSFGDLLVGFDFAPIVFFNDEMNALEVDMNLVHDVREQALGKGENDRSSGLQRKSTVLSNNASIRSIGNKIA